MIHPDLIDNFENSFVKANGSSAVVGDLATKRDALLERRKIKHRSERLSTKEKLATLGAAAVMLLGFYVAYEHNTGPQDPTSSRTSELVSKIESAQSKVELGKFTSLNGEYAVNKGSTWRSDPQVLDNNQVLVFGKQPVKIVNGISVTDEANPLNPDWIGAESSDGHWYFTSSANLEEEINPDDLVPLKEGHMPHIELSN